jgi:hypothetical protein
MAASVRRTIPWSASAEVEDERVETLSIAGPLLPLPDHAHGFVTMSRRTSRCKAQALFRRGGEMESSARIG